MSVLLVSLSPEVLTLARREALECLSGGRELILTEDREQIETVLDQVEIIIGAVPRDLLAKAPRLQWYQQMGTGTEWLLKHPEAIEHPFILTNCSDDYGVVLAEHMMALMLAMARQLPEEFALQQKRVWGKHPFSDPKRFELRGKTLLLAGVGSIGKTIARMASGFQMKVIGLRRDPGKEVEGIEQLFSPDTLLEVLPEADLIINSLPHTKETEQFFDTRAFDAMKPSACFFNVGRSITVDENAMIKALQENRIAGAGLDVFEEEPLPPESPLWQLPNVIITPHSAGNHSRRYESWVETVFDNLERFIKDQPLRNRVDKQRGY
jgi:phosphoglycerate dehydrogenase-like enzyme